MFMRKVLECVLVLSVVSLLYVACVDPPLPIRNLTNEEKLLFLNVHNKYRQMALNGTIPGQPAASEMPMLGWDNELAKKAANWSRFCLMKHDDKADRKTSHYWYVGQNLAGNYDLQKAMERWYGEYVYYNYGQNTCAEKKACGHYTQIVWADTINLGCGYADCSGVKGFLYGKTIVCNYGPGGNIRGQKPYRTGVKTTTTSATTKTPTTTTRTSTTSTTVTTIPTTRTTTIKAPTTKPTKTTSIKTTGTGPLQTTTAIAAFKSIYGHFTLLCISIVVRALSQMPLI